MACGVLVPQPGIKPTPPAVEVWSPNHWTTRQVPVCVILDHYFSPFEFCMIAALLCVTNLLEWSGQKKIYTAKVLRWLKKSNIAKFNICTI